MSSARSSISSSASAKRHESHIGLMSTSPSQMMTGNQVHAEAAAVHDGLRSSYHRRRSSLSNPPGRTFQSSVQPCGTVRPSWARKAWSIHTIGLGGAKVSYLRSGMGAA